MRFAAWLSIAFAVVSALAIFMPGLELEISGVSLGKRASISLYKAAKERDVARALLEKYHAAGSRKLGERAADVVLEHASKHAKKAHVDDARDAMSTLDDVSDSDLKIAGHALVGLTWGYPLLVAIMVFMLFGATNEDAFTRGRAVGGVVLGVLVAAAAAAVYIGWNTAVGEANDEVGAPLFAMGVGAMMMPVCAGIALAGAIATLILRAKRNAQRA